MRRSFRSGIVLILVFSLFSCNRATFTPKGEIYNKTKPSIGDSGVSEVVDITIEKALYATTEEITIPVQIGVGHKKYGAAADGRVIATLEIKVWMDVGFKEEPTVTQSFDYPDWGSNKYVSTEEEDKPWYLFWAPIYYGEFYPLYHETFMWTIPPEVNFGYLQAYICRVDTKTNTPHNTEPLWIRFERVDGNLQFSIT